MRFTCSVHTSVHFKLAKDSVMHVVFVAVLILAVSNTHGLHPNYVARVKECGEEHAVDGKERDIEVSFGSTGAVLDENDLSQKCFVACLADGTGVYRQADGKMDVERMMSEPHSIAFEVMVGNVSGEPLTREQFRADIEACAKIVDEDQCEMGYKQIQCLRIFSLQLYKIVVDLNKSHNMTTPDIP